MPTMTEKPEWLRADVRAKTGTVDRDKGIIHGVILAEEGEFKDKRGEFDRAGIRKAVSLAKEKTSGLKARFTHPSLSSDGLGKFLGRYHDMRSDTVLREVGRDDGGKPLVQEKLVARGDLHLDQTALQDPPGGGKPLGIYVMDLAESDGEALGASLVLKVDRITRLDKNKRPLKDETTGEDLPPLWMPTQLHAADVVDDGDATHSFLSADILAGLPDAIVRQGCELLDAQFASQSREVVAARLSAFMDRYLAYRFGSEDEQIATAVATSLQVKLAEGKQEAIDNGDLLTGTGADNPPLGVLTPAAPAVDEGLLLSLYVMENE